MLQYWSVSFYCLNSLPLFFEKYQYCIKDDNMLLISVLKWRFACVLFFTSRETIPVEKSKSGKIVFSMNQHRYLLNGGRVPGTEMDEQLNYFKTGIFHFNPYLNWGGGQFDPPPARNPWLRRDRRWSRHAFSWLFSFKSYASFDTKFAKIGPSVARSRNFLYSHVGSKFAQNPHFAYVCVQNTWKLLIFLKCSKSVFILSFWPFAQFLISWN